MTVSERKFRNAIRGSNPRAGLLNVSLLVMDERNRFDGLEALLSV